MLKERLKQFPKDTFYKFTWLLNNYLLRLEKEQFIFLEKTCSDKLSLISLQDLLRKGLYRTGRLTNYKMRIIADPESKSNQKVLKVTKVI